MAQNEKVHDLSSVGDSRPSPAGNKSTIYRQKGRRMTEDERELLEQYLTHLNILGEEATHPDFEGLVPRSPLRPGPRSTVHPAGSLRAALQGPLGRRLLQRGSPLFTLRHRRLWARPHLRDHFGCPAAPVDNALLVPRVLGY